MEEIILKKEKIQSEALRAWIGAGKRASLQIITGLGKTKIAMEAVKLMPIDSKILFLAEATDRELELKNEQRKWGAENYTIDFACYQSACKWINTNWDLVIADEVDCSLTPIYGAFYQNNSYKYIMGLTATIDHRAKVFRDNPDNDTTKLQMLHSIAPVCYTYTVNEGQSEGTARILDVYIIHHKLDLINKNMKAGNKLKSFLQTEYEANVYMDKMFANTLRTCNDGLIRIMASKRAKFLYNLPSKVKAVKQLIEGLDGKTIIFGNSLEALDQITPNVISSKKSASENDFIRKSFDEGSLQTIGSFKKLERGANLVGLDNCVLMSYYSQEKNLVQRIGRLRNNGLIGRVFVFVTFGTQEQKWFEKMFTNMDNLNTIDCYSVEECLKKYKESYE